ncbi:TPA: phage tail fiber protein [Klebsiella quasipneumoniae subsp. quasipneumoniae]
MSVPNQTPYNIYTANGLTTVFAYQFYIISASDLEVSINGSVVTSAYTVSGVGNKDGGDITFLTPPANGAVVMLERVVPTYRLTDYQDNGDLLADTINKDFDRIWMAIQRAFVDLGLALTRPLFGGPFNARGYRIENLDSPVNDQDAATKKYVVDNVLSNLVKTLRVPESSIMPLPAIESRKNKIVAMDNNGDPLMVLPESGSAADVMIELAKPTGAYLSGYNEETVGDVLDRIDADASVKNNPLGLLLQTGGLIQFGIDSLNEGAGNTNYVRYLKVLLHSSFNYGGPGFYAFDQASFQIEGDQSFYATGTYTSMRNLAMDAYPAKYAPAGRGLYWSAATGTEQCGGDPKLPWDKCNFYYLKKPGAGSFTVTAGGVETIVSCDGDLDLGVVQLSRDATNASSVTVTGITGEVIIFGADFIYSPNARGIRTATIARGGRKLSEFVTQDATFVVKWKSALNPKLVVVNAGTNDLGQGRTLAQFSADMDTYLSQVVPSGSAVLIVEPTETSKTNDSAYAGVVEQYRVYRRDYAIANGYYYLDDRLTLGSYSVATSKGWMNDETHPNVTGNKLRASAMACLMGANTVVPAEFKYAPRIINTGSMGKITTDFPPVASGAGVNNSKTLWSFGIVGGYNAAIVNVTAFLRTRTTQKYSRIRAVVLISNGTANDNWATGARILSHEWDNWDAETTSTPSITAAINANNLVEISIAATGDYGFYCSAKATMDLIEAPKNHAQSLWLASSTESLLFNFTVTS